VSKFPVYYSGLRLTAGLLTSGQWDKTVKQASSTKVNNTLANDSELTGFALGVGTWKVHVMILAFNTGSATPDLKTQWAFSGTWNNPNRACTGPSSTNTAAPDVVTPTKMRVDAANTNVSYGLAASATVCEIHERSATVVVTVAGSLSLQWAQTTTDAVNATTVAAGSFLEYRQIA
jgi:hypothetical protein